MQGGKQNSSKIQLEQIFVHSSGSQDKEKAKLYFGGTSSWNSVIFDML